MFMFNRKALAAIGVAVAGTTTLLAAPAQAAATGMAEVPEKHINVVRFTAAAGKANSLTITVSGRTVTLDDKVAIKAGRGCKAVKGDRTKVKCTTARKPTEISVFLGDKNDRVFNNTAVPMAVNGGSGNDVLTGGTNRDRLWGDGGKDYIAGREGNDAIDGGTGNDHIDAGSGNDWASADAGNDIVHGDAGNDTLYGDAGNDTIGGGSGNDNLTGGRGKDKITGGPGKDKITQ